MAYSFGRTQSPGESQGQTERTDFPQSGQKCPESDGERKGLHPGMVGLLRDSEYEDNDATMGRMAKTETSGLHMETMEGSESENPQPHEVGHTEIQSPQMGICQGLLECSRESGVTTLNNKRTTRTSRILQPPGSIRVVALKRLNRRVRNRTHGGVRGRGYSAPPTRLCYTAQEATAS